MTASSHYYENGKDHIKSSNFYSGLRLNGRTISTEQCALETTAVYTLPRLNLSKALLKSRVPTKIVSALHLRASSIRTLLAKPFFIEIDTTKKQAADFRPSV